MQKQLILALVILLSTSMAQISKNNPLNDFLSRCADGQIAQGYSLACQIVKKSSVLYRPKERSDFSKFLILPSNAGIERHLKANGISLKELLKPSVSISFTQAHSFVSGIQNMIISVNGNPIFFDQVAKKITVNGVEIPILGKEDERAWASYIFYVDNPLDFQNLKATNASFPIPKVDYQVKGEDVRLLPIFAIVDQCAKSQIFPEHSLSCQAIQNSGFLLRSQTLSTCFGIRAILLPTNRSLEHTLKEKNITPAAFLIGNVGKNFSRVHLGCLPSDADDFVNETSTEYYYVPFEKWASRMMYFNYTLKLSNTFDTAPFFPTSVDVIHSKEINSIAAQLLPSPIQNYYKSHLRCDILCEYLLLDKPLPF
jgi:hypothetical protein